MASHLKVTSHFGINGELSIISLDADILASNLMILFVYLKFGLNISILLQYTDPFMTLKDTFHITPGHFSYNSRTLFS